MLLVLAEDEVVGLEEEALDDAEAVAAPRDEVGDVVPGEERPRFGSRQELGRGQVQDLHRDYVIRLTGRLSPLHVFLRVFPHVVRVLKQKTNLKSVVVWNPSQTK